jgi:hypothetical protein
MKKITDIINLEQKLIDAETEYNYQGALTYHLDNHTQDFTDRTILEIVLWKVNRYPDLNPDIINEINSLRKSYNEAAAKSLIRKILDLKGFDLPMASTVMRFALPKRFQIIDQRVYRIITPKEDLLKMPHNKDKKVEFYFDYLKRLKEICQQKGIVFSKADRVLYTLDKKENGDVAIRY